MGGKRTAPSGQVYQQASPYLVAMGGEIIQLDALPSVEFADIGPELLAQLGQGWVSELAGLGGAGAKRLAVDLDVHTVADLAQSDVANLSSLGIRHERAAELIYQAQSQIIDAYLDEDLRLDREAIFDGELPDELAPLEAIDDSELDYQVIDRNSLHHKSRYALLDKISEENNRNWRVITRPVEDFDIAPDPSHTFGLTESTFEWVKDGKIVAIYVDGMDQYAFYEALGLEWDRSNPVTTAKRVSRILRPQAVAGFFERSAIDVQYVEDVFGETSAHDGVTWDGAGIVSRQTLLDMMEQLPEDMDARTRARMTRNLQHAKRVEFTIMTDKGQEKGHAIVSETMDHNFVLPRDVKTQVKFTDPNSTYLSFDFPHAAVNMRLDIQSMINMFPFFSAEKITQWLEDERLLMEEAVRTGDIANAMQRLDPYTTIEDVEQWALREYVVSNGDIHQSSSHVKAFFRGAIKRLQKIEDGGIWDEHGKFIRDGKLKSPIPGGRFYVMPVAVGQAAGQELDVKPGEVYLDKASETAWVNDADWYQMHDGASEGDGIAQILGGADNDDSLWFHPFTDHDEEQKVVAWRSPNQNGEYVVLKPTASSNNLAWQTVAGEVLYPAADSRLLSKRIDHALVDGDVQLVEHPDLDQRGLVMQVAPPPLAPDAGIHEASQVAARQELINKNTLGATCNWMMIHTAAEGHAPREMPDRLEEIIDLKKTGFNGEAVIDYVQNDLARLLILKTPIPQLLHPRIGWGNEAQLRSCLKSLLESDTAIPDLLHPKLVAAGQTQASKKQALLKALNNSDETLPAQLLHPRFGSPRRYHLPTPIASEGHWLDQVQTAFSKTLEQLKVARDEFGDASMPAIEVFDFVQESRRRAQADERQPDYYALGSELNQVYHRKRIAVSNSGQRKLALEEARQAAETYLAGFPEHLQEGITLGSMVAGYAPLNAKADDSSSYDGVAWLMGSKDETGKRQPGISNVTMRALRGLGVLDAIAQDEKGLVVYPEASIRDRQYAVTRVTAVYRALFDADAERNGTRKWDAYDTKNNPEDKAARKQVMEDNRVYERVSKIANSERPIDLEVRVYDYLGQERLGLFSQATGLQFGSIHKSEQGRYEAGMKLRFRGGFTKTKGGDIASVLEHLAEDENGG
ncbi:MAG: hypothetical protein WBC91_20500 [Phototrophicaceae bacterium]